MIVKNIILSNFRNYSHLNLNLNPGMNIFVGKNAQGKTNILESICILALTKTYKSGVESNIIQFGKKQAKLKAKVKKNGLTNYLEIDIDNGNKSIKVNHDDIKKIGDYISNLNVIVFTPEDLDIIKGSPHIRRNLINMQLSQVLHSYINTYNEYNKILKIRNEYLKLLLTSSIADKNYLDVITDKLIEKAIIIYQERKKYLDLVNERIGIIFKNITSSGNLVLKYVTNIDFDSFESEDIRNKMKHIYYVNYKKELNYGMTLYGPHRDDFSFYLDSNDLKCFGSQGQQKLAVIAFKLSEIDIFKEYSGENPVLLLDDIFSELDIQKRNKLLSYINDGIQSIITTTDLKNIRKSSIKDAYVFKINNGNVERRS